RRRLGELERRGDLRPLGAVTDHFRAGAAAGEKLQGIDENRLPRPGLAGEHGEPRAQLELERLDDREIANLQTDEHGAGLQTQRPPLPRPQWSFERSRR